MRLPRLTRAALALALLLLPLVAGAKPKKLVLLVTGDNGGELVPSAPPDPPSGGLARRATVIAQERDAGVPVLVLDAGNALFPQPTRTDVAGEEARAALLLEQMDALGTAAMAVGSRDLTLGVDFLLTRGKALKMKLLSANLVAKGGKAPFPASTVLSAGGLRVGVIGVSPEGPVGEVMGKPVLPAVLNEAGRLRTKEKVDVVVVLAAVPVATARQMAQQGKGVDFVLQSHQGREPVVGFTSTALGPLVALLVEGWAPLIPSPLGTNGRQVARLELSVEGAAGLFANLSGRDKERFKQLSNAISDLDRMARFSTDLQQKRQALRWAKELKAEKELVQERVKRGQQLASGGEGRAYQLSYTPLGPEIPSDPVIQKRVEALAPPSLVSP